METISLHTNEEKSRALFEAFFLTQDVSASMQDNYDYPKECFQMKTVKNKQIWRAIKCLSPFKALGPDVVPNAILKYNAKILIPILGPLYRATFTLNYYLEKWKTYTTVELWKPGKPNYSNLWVYRGITLLSTISKVLSVYVAEVLMYWSKKLALLPSNQFGGHLGRITNNAIHTVATYTKQAWRQSDAVMLLFLDVCATFPSIVIKRLVHDMRKRGVLKKLMDWIEVKLRGCSTTITTIMYHQITQWQMG